MAKDLTNQQLFELLTGRFDSIDNRFNKLEGRFGRLEGRFDKLEEMVGAISDTLESVIDTIATKDEFDEFKESVHADFDHLELRLGRRIDNALVAGNFVR